MRPAPTSDAPISRADLDRARFIAHLVLRGLADPEYVDLLAERFAAASPAPEPPRGRVLTSSQVAEQYGVSVDYVRDHAEAMGGTKPTGTPKARWSFSEDSVEAFFRGPA